MLAGSRRNVRRKRHLQWDRSTKLMSGANSAVSMFFALATRTFGPSAVICSDIHRQYEQFLVKDGLDQASELEKEVAPIVVDITNRGMPFDAASAGPVKDAVDNGWLLLRKAAIDWFGIPNLNIASPRLRLESVNEKSLSEGDSEGASPMLRNCKTSHRSNLYIKTALK